MARRARLGNVVGATATVAGGLGPVAKAVYLARETACSSAGRTALRVLAASCARKKDEGFLRFRLRKGLNTAFTAGLSTIVCAAGADRTELAMNLVCDGNVGKLLPAPPAAPGYAPHPGSSTETGDTTAYFQRQQRADPRALATNLDVYAELTSTEMGYSASDAKRAVRFLSANGLDTRPRAQRMALALLFLTAGAEAALASARRPAAAGLSLLHGWTMAQRSQR